MAGLIRVSDAASLALHALAYLAKCKAGRVSTKDIAKSLQASEAHLAKVMQRLEHSGLVSGKRGPTGGFELQRKPGELTLLEIYEIVEGPAKSSRCLLGQQMCNDECPLGHLFHDAEENVITQLQQTTLEHFAQKSGVTV